MVRVPTYDGPQVAPTPLRVSQDIRAPAAAFGAATAQAFEQAGQQIGQVASLIDRRAEQHAKEDADTKAFETFTAAASQARQLMWEGDNAIYNRRGENAMGSTKEATIELKRIGEESLAGLDSEYARKTYQQYWARHQESELGSVSRHEAGQRKEYQDQAIVGTLKVFQDQAALYYNDQSKVDEAIALGRKAINTNPQGLPAEALKARETAFTSKVQAAVVLRRMVTDAPGAEKYFREHAADFTDEDILTVERALKVKTTQFSARSNADRIQKDSTVGGTVGDLKAPEGAPPISRTFSAQVQTESGGRQVGADGKLIVSSAGNYGISQINDDSGREAAEALKIPWDPALARGTTEEAKAYNLKLGQQYKQMKLDEFGGNETLALAAYHAGSGNVRQWIKDFGDPRDGKISEAAWVAKIPAPLTRRYIGNVKTLAGGEERIDWQRANDEINKITDPDERDQTRTELEHRQSDINRVRTEKQKVARDKAQDLILQGVHWDDIPGEIIADMEPTAQSALKTWADHIRKGEEIKTDPETHATLNDLAGNDREGFAKYDLRGVRDKLSPTDMAHFEELQRQYRVAGDKADAAHTGERTRVQIANDTLRSAGIDPTPKDTDTKGATKVKVFHEALDRAIRAWKVANEGKMPTSDDITKMADRLVIQGTLKGTGRIWDDTAFTFELTPENRAKFAVPFDKIPAGEKADIIAEMNRNKVAVSNDLVEEIYGAVVQGDAARAKQLARQGHATVVPVH